MRRYTFKFLAENRSLKIQGGGTHEVGREGGGMTYTPITRASQNGIDFPCVKCGIEIIVVCAKY
jgi:hypothetical protein